MQPLVFLRMAGIHFLMFNPKEYTLAGTREGIVNG